MLLLFYFMTMAKSKITDFESIAHDREKRLRYFNEHKRLFDVENYYLLEKYEEFVEGQKHNCLIECGIKINLDRFYASRFNLGYLQKEGSKEHLVIGAFDFFSKIETRVEAKIDYQLIQDFLDGFDYNKILNIFVGVDGRAEIAESRVKLFLQMENYPEKIEEAMSFYGDRVETSEIRQLISYNNLLLIGVDFYLDGRTAVELYPVVFEEDLHRADLRELVGKMLPSKALKLLKDSEGVQIGFSKANKSKVFYFVPINPSLFVESLGNEIAKRANAYYGDRQFLNMVVAIPESELRKTSIQRLNMYYCLR